MIKKTNTNINTKDKKGKGQSKNEDSGSTRKRGRPLLTQSKKEQAKLNKQFNDGKEELDTTPEDELLEEVPEVEEKEVEMDPEMLEMYNLLKKFDTTKLEKFNTVLSMHRQSSRVVNTVTFKINYDVNLDVSCYNIKTPQELEMLVAENTVIANGIDGMQHTQQQQQVSNGGIKPLERFRFILEYKDYNARTELDRLTKTMGARKFPNYAGTEIMEQFHKPLLGKLLATFEDLRNHVKYDENEIHLRFTNFNFVGGMFVAMAIVNYFKELGTISMGRHNGQKAKIMMTQTENPTFRVTFSKEK